MESSGNDNHRVSTWGFFLRLSIIFSLSFIFIGYSLVPGDAMETLINVPNNQKIETPVAENLMVGLAIGMSFEGFKPVS